MHENTLHKDPINNFFQMEYVHDIKSYRSRVAGKEYDPDSYTCYDYSSDLIRELRSLLPYPGYSVGLVATGEIIPKDLSVKTNSTGLNYDEGHGMVLITLHDNSQGVLMEPQMNNANWLVNDPLGKNDNMSEIIINHLKSNIDYPPDFQFEDVRFGVLFTAPNETA